MRIDGEHNSAIVHTEQSVDEAESEAVEQIQEIVDHEAFTGDDNIKIMPDFHWGAGAVIGFTMPVKQRICPNTVGVDIGCGMYAVNFGRVNIDLNETQKRHEVDQAIRERVPTGFDVHSDTDYRMAGAISDFPYQLCENKWARFDESTEFDLPRDGEQFPEESYFTDLCKRIEYDERRAINSVGTLGGGNHFIELGLSEDTGDLWCIIHSGSRGIGAEIAKYWQDKATTVTTTRKSIDDVPESVRTYMGDNWKPLADKIRANFDGENIQRKFDEVSQAIERYGPSANDRNTDLDYLEGEEAHGYINDMIFAQTYARESRKQMAISVSEALDDVGGVGNGSIQDSVESVHNYIDFNDGVIRKGACRAHDGELVIIPFNMSYGTLLCRGKGNNDWNNSAPHGAGRAMSRTEAERQYTEEDMREQVGDTYLSVTPIDETPRAYKDPSMIERAIGPSVEIVDRVKPILSVKAE